MSANIPFDLQVEIVKKLIPIKSLIRFRSVSKQWKSLIDSSRFIIDQSLNQTQPHRMLISCIVDDEDKYFYIVDDDRFPRNKVSPILPPPNVKTIPYQKMFDCSHGLVCVHGRDNVDGKYMVVLWNPSIRKYVEIVLSHGPVSKVVGTGVCSKTGDPKIVKVSADGKAEVFTLSIGAWRSILVNLCQPLESLSFNDYQVVMDGVIHWVAYDLNNTNATILSFDLTSEKFGEVALPDSSSPPDHRFIYKLNESLALVDHNDEFDLCDVWMMIKNGVNKSAFTKLYTIDFKRLDNPRLHGGIIGFRMNGQPIVREVDMRDVTNPTVKLKVYEPYSKHIKDLEIDTPYGPLFGIITFYTESLLLLDHFTYNI